MGGLRIIAWRMVFCLPARKTRYKYMEDFFKKAFRDHKVASGYFYRQYVHENKGPKGTF
jgi:hypothetical protein